jgi:TetR/AcrR family transcriptional regulator, regulator of cefoperazone and chloramphenicol sensitivity
VPRDATETRNRLLREAERLFATRGIHRTTTREILDAAEQRNVSALSYHFGSRAGVLREILLRHGDDLDRERGELLALKGETATTRDLVAALLVPLAGQLATPDGRDYLRIVAQMTGEFPAWRVETELTPPNLRRILGLLETGPEAVPPEVRRERIVLVIMLMTSAMAERARALDAGDAPLELDEAAFIENLTDVIVAALQTTATPQALTGVGRRGSSPAAS